MNSTADPAWVLETLLRAYGPQHWWPADSRLEVIAGAVLVQNTAWRNAEHAVRRLRERIGLESAQVLSAGENALADAVRPAGTFRVKARRLLAVHRFLADNGSVQGLSRWPTLVLRNALLQVHGVGPETADAMLLYAFGRPVFIADAYAQRLFGRLGTEAAGGDYQQLADWVELQLEAEAEPLNELHALVVRHCKDVCMRVPECGRCCLAAHCESRRGNGAV